MSFQKVHTCECPICCQRADHPDKVIHRQFNVVLSRLNEQLHRWMVALDSKKIGHGGNLAMTKVSGISVETIRKGRKELEEGLKDRPVDRVRLPGGGRPRIEKRDSGVCDELKPLVEDESDGEPMGGKKFVRSTLRNLAERSGKAGRTKIARLLDSLGFPPRVNVSMSANTSDSTRCGDFRNTG